MTKWSFALAALALLVQTPRETYGAGNPACDPSGAAQPLTV